MLQIKQLTKVFPGSVAALMPSKSVVPFLLLWGACGIPTIVAWTALVGMV